jgi:hypothetical protein
MVKIMADILPIDVSFTEDKDIVASPDDLTVKGHVPRNTSPSRNFHLLSNTSFDTAPPMINEDIYVSDNPTQVHSKLNFDVSSSSVMELLSAAKSGSKLDNPSSCKASPPALNNRELLFGFNPTTKSDVTTFTDTLLLELRPDPASLVITFTS